MIAAHPRERGGDSAQRAARRLIVRDKPDIHRSPRRISLRGNKKFLQLSFSQKVKLNSPKRQAAKQHRRFVPTHSARFAAGEQNRADRHWFAAATRAVERRTPSFKICARKRPRPRKNSSAPGPM